jgi:hypothetical protein
MVAGYDKRPKRHGLAVEDIDAAIEFAGALHAQALPLHVRFGWRIQSVDATHLDVGCESEALVCRELLASVPSEGLVELLRQLASVAHQRILALSEGQSQLAHLGLSAGNVRVIRHRGIGKLRRCVDPAGAVT